jgi:L-aspartate oxidase
LTGVVALQSNGCPLLLQANDTVLATGGIGQLYLHTTNPTSARGDGLAMALDAGARCRGLEFVQFHPTALDCAADPVPLITEALRGAGGVLVDEYGKRLMPDIHPAADLAPRDVVARAVWHRKQRGQRVFLDATGVLAREARAFPSVRELCERHGIDPTSSPIPVVPAAHYHMGGIDVDLDGRSSVQGLWACGEVACSGAHGANRLASNSLLEAVVFGRRLGGVLSLTRPRASAYSVPPAASITDAAIQAKPEVWNALRCLMSMRLGIVREARGLQAGLFELASLSHRTPGEHILVRNRLRLARAMLHAALLRSESCGAHVRADSPVVWS